MHPVLIRALSIVRIAECHFEDLGLIQDLVVEAENLFVFTVGG